MILGVRTSLFEIFKIGIGPSSSHTVGPMRAAKQFADSLASPAAHVVVDLYGSLALTGRGHGTDRAILLGLSGETPDQVDTAQVEAKLAAIRRDHAPIEILFHVDQALARHPIHAIFRVRWRRSAERTGHLLLGGRRLHSTRGRSGTQRVVPAAGAVSLFERRGPDGDRAFAWDANLEDHAGGREGLEARG